ncbi:MAG TPA: ABC-F family ATP-binding cassette domain-containing protein [Blastocatellia bacterium]|nr:ABC-F family ATP-binding cassette domain-containing protein [Blastocatellia bacterium]
MVFQFDDVHKSYGAEVVLHGVSFQVNPGERVGLVGRNGAGKTTIFRLLNRSEEPDSGRIVLIRGLRIGWLEQQPVFRPDATIKAEALAVFDALHRMESEMERLEHSMAEAVDAELEEVLHSYADLRHEYELAGGFSYAAKAESVLFGLGFSGDDLERPALELSGGQKARLALARLLLTEPDLLLLDEPTNHLDVSSVEWLEEFLGDYPGAFVIISHDRFLLDRTVTKVVEVADGKAANYPGNYTAYVKQRDEKRLVQSREFEQQSELIARTEDFIRRNIAGQKTKQAKSRRKMLERLERVEAVRDERAATVRFARSVRSGSDVLTASGLSVGYGNIAIASGLSLLVRRGERVGIIGPNGAGKTTFLKTAMRQIPTVTGEVSWGVNTQIGYYDQEVSTLDERLTVVEELSAISSQTEAQLRGYLARFLFTGDDIFKPVAALSGGERSRLALAKLIFSRPNVLVLDEPTNHLDIPSREALELALMEYDGTIITASHDRYFLDRIATEILHFEDGSVTHHRGSYSDYHLFCQTQAERQTQHQDVAQSPEPPAKRPKTQPAVRKDSGRTVKEIESEIENLEAELAEVSKRLSSLDGNVSREEIAKIGLSYEALSTRLKELYSEWESVSAASSH